MKKFILFFSLLVAGALTGQAQDTTNGNSGKSGFGLRGGASLFNWSGEDISSNDYTNRVGFHAGVFANSFVGDRFSIEPGLYYSVKGTQNDDLVNSRAVLNYLDLPVLFRFYATEGVNFFAGPQASLLLGSTFEADALGNTYGWETDAINDLDAGLVVGLGYNLPVGLNLQASYDLGLTPVFKDTDADVYNRGFKLSAGISF
ncbi:Outer membrane protein beta-barrel domain-containing protein [Cyclobacterium lianum]|uniref:Outer membrane protein beta-barrel domain-containing protein n=1 Tax=Cyclobacterium lianum TaxID=388280 RepID=A0A1M7QB22_9BACT|nr:porin family protein [Cyclobacterium lianum]SHN27974.1 Outer membrane protein beta-barrel domain-containing protein [Cyclobacterium lianum]